MKVYQQIHQVAHSVQSDVITNTIWKQKGCDSQQLADFQSSTMKKMKANEQITVNEQTNQRCRTLLQVVYV